MSPTPVNEPRIVRELERLGPIRLQRKRFPDADDRRLTQPLVFCQLASTPVGGIAWRRRERRSDRPFNLRVGDFRGPDAAHRAHRPSVSVCLRLWGVHREGHIDLVTAQDEWCSSAVSISGFRATRLCRSRGLRLSLAVPVWAAEGGKTVAGPFTGQQRGMGGRALPRQ